MKIVHVCSYFNTSSLYENYFEALSDSGINQEVFIPLYKTKEFVPAEYGTVKRKARNKENIKYYYDKCLSNIERYFLLYRTFKLYRRLVKKVDINKQDMLHGHSLFANGGICYFANKILKCDYVVSFRQTDLSVYRSLFIYRHFAKLIIRNSKKLIFISHSLKYKFINSIKDEELKKLVHTKGIVIPNGISDKWVGAGVKKASGLEGKEIKFLYQGTLHSRKNIDYIIKIIEGLNKEGISSTLNIIGGGPEKEKLINLISNSRYTEKISLKNWTDNFEDIVDNYQQSNIFIMPSENETFGIAYLEALAVGLPIIYKENDGIDGFFDNIAVGTALSVTDLEKDIKKIHTVINDYKSISENTELVIDKFLWRNICKEYLNVYYKP